MGIIHFNRLPKDQQNQNTINPADWPEDYYKIIIEAAEMKSPKRKTDPDTGQLLPQSPDYLNVRYGVYQNGKRAASVFDMQFESDKNALQFKLRRFVEALGLGISGDFELKDLTKLIVGKTMLARLCVEENAQYGNRLTVKTFDDNIYLEDNTSGDPIDFSASGEETFTPEYAQPDDSNASPAEPRLREAVEY